MALEENLYAISKMETQCIYFLVSIRKIFKRMGISEKKKNTTKHQLSTPSLPPFSEWWSEYYSHMSTLENVRDLVKL